METLNELIHMYIVHMEKNQKKCSIIKQIYINRKMNSKIYVWYMVKALCTLENVPASVGVINQ